jgi:hypothetical protein
MSRRIKVIGVVALLGVAASAFIVTRRQWFSPTAVPVVRSEVRLRKYGKADSGRGRQPEGPVKPGDYQRQSMCTTRWPVRRSAS